jgi:transposase
MIMLAETVDAVIGIDTHRDTHEVEIADPAGRPIAVLQIGNDSAGFARLLAAIAEVAPGPRVAVCMEGSRSYGIGLARVLAAAGLLVLECEQPRRRQRRGKGKSDPIDAHLAVLAALRLDAGKLPVPRADGDREALRILLVARQEITVASTAQIGRLRALLLAGDDTGRRAARTALTQAALTALAGRDLPADACREQAVRHAEIRRLAQALGRARQELRDNRVAGRRGGQAQHRLTRPMICSRRGCGDDLLLDLGGTTDDRLGAAEPSELTIMSTSSGLVFPPVTAGSIESARGAAFARCDLGGEHPPGDRFTAPQLPDPWRGPDDHAEPTAADIPAVETDVDPGELRAAQLP